MVLVSPTSRDKSCTQSLTNTAGPTVLPIDPRIEAPPPLRRARRMLPRPLPRMPALGKRRALPTEEPTPPTLGAVTRMLLITHRRPTAPGERPDPFCLLNPVARHVGNLHPRPQSPADYAAYFSHFDLARGWGTPAEQATPYDSRQGISDFLSKMHYDPQHVRLQLGTQSPATLHIATAAGNRSYVLTQPTTLAAVCSELALQAADITHLRVDGGACNLRERSATGCTLSTDVSEEALELLTPISAATEQTLRTNDRMHIAALYQKSFPQLLGAPRALKAPGAQDIPALHHSVWLGGIIPQEYRNNVLTWRHMHPDETMLLWTDMTAADIVRDAECQDVARFCTANNIKLINFNDIFPVGTDQAMRRTREFQIEYLARQLGGTSDVLRLEALREFGGCYADTDCLAMQNFDMLRGQGDFIVGGELDVPIIYKDGSTHHNHPDGAIHYTNDFIMATPHHPMVDKILDTIAERYSKPLTELYPDLRNMRDRDRRVWSVVYRTGPGALTHTFDAAIKAGGDTHNAVQLPGVAVLHRADNPMQPEVYKSSTHDESWIRTFTYVADQTETASARAQRLVTCVLQSLFDEPLELDLSRLARYLNQPGDSGEPLGDTVLAYIEQAYPQALAQVQAVKTDNITLGAYGTACVARLRDRATAPRSMS